MRMSVRGGLTAGWDWPSRSHSAETCSSLSWARARTIFNRDLSASSLKTSVSRWMVVSETLMGEVVTGGFLATLDFTLSADALFKATDPPPRRAPGPPPRRVWQPPIRLAWENRDRVAGTAPFT